MRIRTFAAAILLPFALSCRSLPEEAIVPGEPSSAEIPDARKYRELKEMLPRSGYKCSRPSSGQAFHELDVDSKLWMLVYAGQHDHDQVTEILGHVAKITPSDVLLRHLSHAMDWPANHPPDAWLRKSCYAYCLHQKLRGYGFARDFLLTTNEPRTDDDEPASEMAFWWLPEQGGFTSDRDARRIRSATLPPEDSLAGVARDYFKLFHTPLLRFPRKECGPQLVTDGLVFSFNLPPFVLVRMVGP